MAEAAGYVLRIATKQWVTQVFSSAIYYTGLRRKWRPDQVALFVHKTSFGDALVGYGVVAGVHEREELTDYDRRACEEFGWRRAIEFKYVVQFERPLLVKGTFLPDLKVRGRFLHGFPLKKDQVDNLIMLGESLK